MLLTLHRRAVRTGAIGLFLGLVLTVSIQHHVATIDFNDDEIDFDDDVGGQLENSDSVDGDELLGRLLLADDVSMPEAPQQTAVVSWVTPSLRVPQPPAPMLPSNATRAPPMPAPALT